MTSERRPSLRARRGLVRVGSTATDWEDMTRALTWVGGHQRGLSTGVTAPLVDADAGPTALAGVVALCDSWSVSCARDASLARSAAHVLEEAQQLDGERHHQGAVLLGGHVGHGLQQPQLHRTRVSAMVLAAAASLLEAWNSPSAEMTRARRSRSASPCAEGTAGPSAGDPARIASTTVTIRMGTTTPTGEAPRRRDRAIWDHRV
jgi:hypothetical protein